MYKFSVDGGFSKWSDFSECSKSCGEGVKQATRTCSNPEPKFGGKLCIGEFVQSQLCNLKECPSKLFFYILIFIFIFIQIHFRLCLNIIFK